MRGRQTPSAQNMFIASKKNLISLKFHAITSISTLYQVKIRVRKYVPSANPPYNQYHSLSGRFISGLYSILCADAAAANTEQRSLFGKSISLLVPPWRGRQRRFEHYFSSVRFEILFPRPKFPQNWGGECWTSALIAAHYRVFNIPWQAKDFMAVFYVLVVTLFMFGRTKRA